MTLSLTHEELDQAVAQLRGRYPDDDDQVLRRAIGHYVATEAGCMVAEIGHLITIVGDFDLSLQAARKEEEASWALH